MLSNEDFRYTAHRHLLELDASNSRLRYLISKGEIDGVPWDDAVVWHQNAYDAWVIFLSQKTQPSLLV
ncbi:hypothetical protein AL532_18820 [Pseudomonas monteilii]|uniref:Uncharacterized protein n=1 Tax=Pseudomonas monteilii TaxID=76759 RepID=A0A7X3F5Q2_9PSED|nr:hypothetical protein AL532_18820 [Pseudomonas monteilii]MVF51942.1 hypothetical protein [Pseudomonas monteilii]BBV97345.1 hypothetical protein STW0522PSE72_26960 [Pseudomonas monteilii]